MNFKLHIDTDRERERNSRKQFIVAFKSFSAQYIDYYYYWFEQIFVFHWNIYSNSTHFSCETPFCCYYYLDMCNVYVYVYSTHWSDSCLIEWKIIICNQNNTHCMNNIHWIHPAVAVEQLHTKVRNKICINIVYVSSPFKII